MILKVAVYVEVSKKLHPEELTEETLRLQELIYQAVREDSNDFQVYGRWNILQKTLKGEGSRILTRAEAVESLRTSK